MITRLEPELLEHLTHHDTHTATTAAQLDDDLARAVRQTAVIRRIFYGAVLAVALYGSATGAVTAFALPWWIAISGVIALELGGMAFLTNADVRRRLGEQATASRILGAAIAATAATFNLVTHTERLLGAFFALMSLLGFVSWWLDVENKRRDRLRARGMLPAPPPHYHLLSHWLRHPLLTAQARRLAETHPRLGRNGSLEAAHIVRRRRRRNAALEAALHTRIRAAVGRRMADIAALTYDMDEVARRVRADADYDGLTALLTSELTATRILHTRADASPRPALGMSPPPGSLAAHTTTAGKAPSATAQPDAHKTIPNPRQPRRIGAAGNTTLTPRRPAQPIPAATPSPPAATLETPGTRVRITVVGAPAVLDTAGQPLPGLRAKSLEVLVYLVLHRHGATIDDILRDIWPDTDTVKAGQRLSTCLANLRSAVRSVLASRDSTTATGLDHHGETTPSEPVVNTGSRYHLNPTAVTVDWWQLLDAHDTDPTPATLAAVQAARAHLAEPLTSRWLQTGIRRPATASTQPAEPSTPETGAPPPADGPGSLPDQPG
ncbi:hypothetical protein [Dactylosporangium matsuzakiense]|uniref:DNA-binding SARP family transcriptional activator n=1 Tax=Dactylosporangium matsuzakiense TaxID=53360 RepID=A0A9W6KVN5_9ACTN|nr:hypothetical protein [Dactylosporangium matsuzakiense]GLL08025.1 hypothetical protein GCM10017581_097850 [Dactylosporangium matsuzakiense]